MRRAKTFALVLAGAVAIAAPAQAGSGGVTTEVTMKKSKNNQARFKGQVKSTQDSCVVGRKVQIFRAQPGADQKVDKTFASESGKWFVVIPMQNGNKLYAKVKGFQPPVGSRCAPDTSPKVNA